MAFSSYIVNGKRKRKHSKMATRKKTSPYTKAIRARERALGRRLTPTERLRVINDLRSSTRNAPKKKRSKKKATKRKTKKKATKRRTKKKATKRRSSKKKTAKRSTAKKTRTKKKTAKRRTKKKTARSGSKAHGRGIGAAIASSSKKKRGAKVQVVRGGSKKTKAGKTKRSRARVKGGARVKKVSKLPGFTHKRIHSPPTKAERQAGEAIGCEGLVSQGKDPGRRCPPKKKRAAAGRKLAHKMHHDYLHSVERNFRDLSLPESAIGKP